MKHKYVNGYLEAEMLHCSVQPTWRTMRAAVQQMPCGEDATLQDLELLAALSPEVVMLLRTQECVFLLPAATSSLWMAA